MAHESNIFVFDSSWMLHSELDSVSGDDSYLASSYSEFCSCPKNNFALCNAVSLCRRPNWDIGTPMQLRSSAESPILTMKWRLS